MICSQETFASFYQAGQGARPNVVTGHMKLLGVMSNPVIDPLEVQRDIQEWLQYLLGMTSVYPLRFAAAEGLILLICGLVVFGLAAGTKRDRANDWRLAELRAGRRQAVLVALFCTLGIGAGILFARFAVLSHSAVIKPAISSPSNPIDQPKVWEDPHHGVYYCSGSSWFGKTKGGRVTTLRQARYDGFRPYATPCPLSQSTQKSSQH